MTEVQVRASSAKDMDSHFLWELIHLRSQLQRRSEKVYVLSNRLNIKLCFLYYNILFIIFDLLINLYLFDFLARQILEMLS